MWKRWLAGLIITLAFVPVIAAVYQVGAPMFIEIPKEYNYGFKEGFLLHLKTMGEIALFFVVFMGVASSALYRMNFTKYWAILVISGVVPVTLYALFDSLKLSLYGAYISFTLGTVYWFVVFFRRQE